MSAICSWPDLAPSTPRRLRVKGIGVTIFRYQGCGLTGPRGTGSLNSARGAMRRSSMTEPAIPRILPHREDGAKWPIQGRWTYEDYLRLPDDGNRYEVIRGHLYVTAAPVYLHQFAVLKL